MPSQSAIIECVPNFSEGRDLSVIRQITGAIEQVEGVQLLGVEPGRDANRTVVTFAGAPPAVVEAAFRGIRTAAELIDMRRHRGVHPRMGATDVCPLVPVANVEMEEVVRWAERLAQRVGEELSIPVYLYEHAARQPARRHLGDIRAGEYEALAEKLRQAEWAPDYGPAQHHERAGATVIGARDFLVAYNVNLNTTSVRLANAVAFDVRERGRLQRPLQHDAEGRPLRVAGECRGVKAIGWYIEEYGIAQVSMNLVDLSATALHEAFEACRRRAAARGMRVTGSELVGLIPRQCLLDAGYYYLKQQRRSAGLPEAEVIRIAVKSLGLDELRPFDPHEKVIEYRLAAATPPELGYSSLAAFSEEVASDRVTPGGGAASAYVATLGAALGTMVANLTVHRREQGEQWESFSGIALRGEALRRDLLQLVDDDAAAFQALLAARRLPRITEEGKRLRQAAIQGALQRATEVPLQVMEKAIAAFEVLSAVVEQGLPAARVDAAVGVLCVRAAVRGAFLNVEANAAFLEDDPTREAALQKGRAWLEEAERREAEILAGLKKEG